MLSYRAVLAAALVCGACHHDKAVHTTPVPTASQPAPVAQAKPAPVPVSHTLNASDDLVRKCSLHLANEAEAPKFDFDQAALTTDDRNVLQQIADCITRGPLKGKKLQLVGRADPRGTEEYNMGLGDRRAHTVSEYLERLGVKKVDAKTRGSLDASGTDENSWRQDRRVDLQVN
jgi:peptidoglycan-associated lipoprotein